MDHEFRVKVGCQVACGKGAARDTQMILLMNGEDVRIQIPDQHDVVVSITNLDLAISHLTAVRKIVKRHEQNEADEEDELVKKRAVDLTDDDEDFEGEHDW